MLDHRIITLSDGQQIIVQERGIIALEELETSEAVMTDSQPVDMTDEQFNDIMDIGTTDPEKTATMIQNISDMQEIQTPTKDAGDEGAE